MEALSTFWNFLLLGGLIAFPQLLGVLVYFKLRPVHRWLGRVAGTLLPVILFIGFSWMIFVYRYYKLHPDDSCGGQLFGASLLVLVGSAIEIGLSVVVQVLLYRAARRSADGIKVS
jgi:hypothetical protein